MAKSVAFSQSSFLLTSLSHLKNVIDYSLVGPSLNSAPVPSVTFHSLLFFPLLDSYGEGEITSVQSVIEAVENTLQFS